MKVFNREGSGRRHGAGALWLGAALFTLTPLAAGAEEIGLRASGLVSTHKYHVALEREFYASLPEKTGVDFKVNYNPLDVLGVSMKDTLRLGRKGTFDIVQSTVGEASRDDPFLEGLDLIGVSPTLDALQKAIDAYREVFSKRVEEKFNVKVMSLWPYGPQVFYCKAPIKGLADFSGLKVRTYSGHRPLVQAIDPDLDHAWPDYATKACTAMTTSMSRKRSEPMWPNSLPKAFRIGRKRTG